MFGVFDTWCFQPRAPSASLRLVLLCSVSIFQVTPVHLLSFRWQHQLWNPQFKLPDNNPTTCAVFLKNGSVCYHLGAHETQAALEAKVYVCQIVVRITNGEWEFQLVSTIRKQSALFDCRVCRKGGSRYDCCVAVKIPNLIFYQTSCIIVPIVQYSGPTLSLAFLQR